VKGQGAVLNEAGGTIAYRFHARDLHLAMNPGAATVPFRVRLDGEAPGASHGGDVDSTGNGVATEPRLYQLIRQPGRIDDRTFEITFLEPGVEASVFTFG
jgi:thioredoxin family protein